MDGKRYYATEASAKGALTRNVNAGKVARESFEVISSAEYQAIPRKMMKVRNLMSGIEVEIPVDTPLCCDPSSETYWSS
jgi:hypothetical protein